MKTIKSTHIPESYKRLTHSSGLEILLYPMEGYKSAYALFATNYGSVDTTFKTTGDDDFVTVPEGIAHFLEHKLFESDKGDAFTRYAETGASANAYTSFDRTAYLFSCTENFEQSLEILLDFVTDPYFTPESVEKEQGIIGQEITMYQDDPDWRVFFGLLQGMYHNNPVSIDIAGTIESISEIDADLLYRSYNTFYNLHNMVLVVAGNFDVDIVVKMADKILKPAEKLEITRQVPEEPESVKQKEVEISLAVAQPLFQLGFKKQATNVREDLITAIKTDILLDMIAGDYTQLYKDLYESGLINASFSADAASGRGYAYCSFDGESKDPKKVRDKIIAEIERLKQTGLDKDLFEIAKKAAWGKYVGRYGNVTGVAGLVLSSYFSDLEVFEVLDIIQNVKIDELEEILRRDLDPEKTVLSIVNPKE